MYGKTKWIITVVQAIFFLLFFFPGAGGVLFTNIVCLYDNWCYNIYAI